MLVYKFYYDYVKPNYGEKSKSCYMDTDSFIVYLETDYIYKKIIGNVEARFHTSNYELDRPLLKEKNQKSNWKNHDKICFINSKNL